MKETCNEVLVSKIHKELLKLNNKNINNLIKNIPKTLENTLPKRIYRWQVSSWREAPHHLLSRKCKLKQ